MTSSKRIEVEAAAKDRRGFEADAAPSVRAQDARERLAQRIGEKSRPVAGARFQKGFPLAQGTAESKSEKTDCLRFHRADGRPSPDGAGVRLRERRNQGRGVAGLQPSQSTMRRAPVSRRKLSTSRANRSSLSYSSPR